VLTPRAKGLALVALAGLLCGSCAFMDRRNRPLWDYCVRHLVPENRSTLVATAPVVFPACLAAGAADVVLVQPAQVLDDAWYDTAEALWTKRGPWDWTDWAVMPLRAAVTPVVWTVRFASRAVFAEPPWPPSVGGLEKALLDSDAEMRLLWARSLTRRAYSGADAKPATEILLKALGTYPADVEFCEALLLRLPAPLTDEARRHLGPVAQKGRGRLCAAAIDRLFIDCLLGPEADPSDPAHVARVAPAVDYLAGVYDELVRSGRHEAEVAVIALVGYNLRWSWQPGLEALGFHIARSLARRAWPAYADYRAFVLQRQLLATSEAARIEAMTAEWRCLQLRDDWPQTVKRAVARRLGESAGPKFDRTALQAEDREISAKLSGGSAGSAAARLPLLLRLVDIKTDLDADAVAEQLAEKMLKGPKADCWLFFEDPIRLLRNMGDP